MEQVRKLDFSLLAGVFVSACAVIAGIRVSGIGWRVFLHPTGALIVIGGTIGVTLVTTPPSSLRNSLRRLREIFAVPDADRQAVIEELADCARKSRRDGTMSLERLAPSCSDDFLRSGLLMALDIPNRDQLRATLEMELRLRERQGELDAKTFEVAGGFAPTIGIIGTVVGLLDVLRQFSNLSAIGAGIGTAFVSTIYGLALANLLLLPIAHRIRARVAERVEMQELMAEGIMYLIEGEHPALLRLKLAAFLREGRPTVTVERPGQPAMVGGVN